MGCLWTNVKRNYKNGAFALMILILYIPAFVSQSSFSTSTQIQSTDDQSSYLSSTEIMTSNNDVNVTNRMLDSSKLNISEAIQRALLSIVCISIIISCLVGNMLVIIAVIIVRKLHTQDNASNFLIVSLAVSDLLVGVLVMPYAFYVELSEENKWYLGAILCDIWTLSDVLLCTASILNLCAISIDRYFIILHAMVYTQRRNAKLMFGMILVVWVLSALISIPPLFGWGKPSSRLGDGGNICAVSSDLKYQIFATLLAFYLPSITMIIIYFNIYRAAEKINKKEQETNGMLQLAGNHQSNRKLTYQQSNISNSLSINNIKSLRLKDSDSEDCSIESCKAQNSDLSTQNSEFITSIPIMIEETCPNYIRAESRRSSVSAFYDMSRRVTRRLTQAFNGFKRNSNASNAQKKNQKATKALGVIMGCFILCWLPFFVLALIKPISLKNNKHLGDYIPKWLDSFLLWLGYFNSALNPMIYARFNREFRRPFVEILCFRCNNINDKLRDAERKKVQLDVISPTNIMKKKSNGYYVNSVSNNQLNRFVLPESVELMNTNQTNEKLRNNDNLNKNDDKSMIQVLAENMSLDPIVNNSLSSTDELSKLSDPKSYVNSCNSSKLNNFFQNETKNDTPIIICSDYDLNYPTHQITTRKESYGTTMTSETYDSNISIFQQLEMDLTEKTNENMIRSISRFSNVTKDEEEASISIDLPRKFRDEKSLFLKKKFFETEKIAYIK